ncbi:MAG TPA: hypothetical protein VGF88_08425 [Acidobacteriaceae bacterium]
MRSAFSARSGSVFFSLVLTPLVCLAQASGDLPAGSPSPSSSSSVVSLGAPGLPDAPVPTDTQSTTPPSQSTPQIKDQNKTPRPAPQSGTAPTLGDLGFTPQQTLANAEMQRKLNQRTHDLKVHQTLGLVTVVPLCATVIVADGAKAKHNRADPTGPLIEPSSASVDLHAALGASTAALYGFTAYYAIAAPRIPGIKPKGAIKLHRDLVWIHAPGMVLTPILGGMALSQENKGEKVHGIASAHSYVAWTTVGAYGASIVAVSWPIHLKFREK